MKKLFVLILISIFLTSPLKVVFASDLQQNIEAPTEATTTSAPTPPNVIVVYLFVTQEGGALAVAPISENLFVWAYATSTESVDVGLMDPAGIVIKLSTLRLDAYVNNSLVQSVTDSLTAQSSTVVRFNGEIGGTGTGNMYYDEPFFATTAISTSTRDLLYASGTGAEICVTVGCGSGSAGTSTITRYILTDHLNGINVVTDASGTVVETLDYYPFYIRAHQ